MFEMVIKSNDDKSKTQLTICCDNEFRATIHLQLQLPRSKTVQWIFSLQTLFTVCAHLFMDDNNNDREKGTTTPNNNSLIKRQNWNSRQNLEKLRCVLSFCCCFLWFWKFIDAQFCILFSYIYTHWRLTTSRNWYTHTRSLTHTHTHSVQSEVTKPLTKNSQETKKWNEREKKAELNDSGTRTKRSMMNDLQTKWKRKKSFLF